MKSIIFNQHQVNHALKNEEGMFRVVVKNASSIITIRIGKNNQYYAVGDDWAKSKFEVGEIIFVKEAFIADPSCDDDAWDNHDLTYQQWALDFRNNHAKMPESLKNCSNIYYQAGSDNDNILWKNAKIMPKWASRLTLQIKSIRVERLGDISESDCMKEGCFLNQDDMGLPVFGFCEEEVDQELGYRKAQDAFKVYWNATHKKPEEKWEANPFVFCFSYEVVR